MKSNDKKVSRYERVNIGALEQKIEDFTVGLSKIAERIATLPFPAAVAEYKRFISSHSVTFGLVLARETLYDEQQATSAKIKHLMNLKRHVDAIYKNRVKQEQEREKEK